MRKQVFLVLMLLLWGCAPSRSPEPSGLAEAEKIVWPPPPSEARIELSYQFEDPTELGIKPLMRHRIRDWFVGGSAKGFVRPYAVAGDGEWLAIADPGAAMVHVLDLGRKRLFSLSKIGDTKLHSPVGVAIGANRLLVVDSQLAQVFVIDKSMKPLEILDGFQRPTSVVFAPLTRSFFVVDTLAHEITEVGSDGIKKNSFGQRGGAPGEFNFPSHIAVAEDKIVVNDTLNFRIQVLDLDGTPRRTFGQQGLAAGSIAQAKGVAVDRDGHIYVADAVMNWIHIFDSVGTPLMVFGELGPGAGQFDMPAGLAFVGDKLYVADSMNGRIQVFNYLSETVK